MKDHAGTLDEVRAAMFAAKEARRAVDARATPEEKFARLEAMQELAAELRAARATRRAIPPPDHHGK